MKLKQIILKHFGRFQSPRYIDLDDDLVVIHGPNFSGKTTLARALYFALCGKVLTSGLKSQGVVSPHEFSATTGLVYQYQDAAYRLYRSTKGDIRLEIFQQHWQEIDPEQTTLPALTPYQWQIGCFLQEHELGQFLSKAPASRRELLNQLLGVERVRGARDALIMARRLAKRLEKSALSRQNGIRLNDAADCSQELESCRRKVGVLEAQLSSQPDGEERQQRVYEEWRQRAQQLEQQLESLTAESHNLFSGFSTTDELQATLQHINAHLAGRDQAVNAVETCTATRIRLETQMQHIEKQLTELHELKEQGHCPTCLQPLSEDHLFQVERQFQEQRQTLTEALNTARTQEQECRDTLNLLEQLAQRQTDLQQRVEKIEWLHRTETAVRTELNRLQTKLAAVECATDTQQDQLRLRRELEHARVRLKQLETQQAVCQKHRQQLAALNTQAADATHHRLLSEWAADAVEQTMQALIGTSLHRVEARVIECLREFNLIDGRPTLNLETSRLMPDLDGRAFHALSGSEKAILYLSIKLALSRLMTGADFLVLDDPAQHLDDLRRQQMSEFLRSLVPYKQVIILTNDARFAEMFSEGKRIDLSGRG